MVFIMTKNKLIIFLGTLAIVIYSFLLLLTIRLFYLYNFSNILFLVKYPNWVLIIDAVLEIVGICLSVFLLNNKIRLKLYVIITILIFILLYINFVCTI